MLELFKDHTKNGGAVSGATAPSLEVLDDIDYLLHSDGNGCAALWPFVETAFAGAEPGSLVTHPYLDMIRTLSLTSPVCALVKPHIRERLGSLADGTPVTFTDYEVIHEHSPVLARFLRAFPPAPLPQTAMELLSAMCQRADAAYISPGLCEDDHSTDEVRHVTCMITHMLDLNIHMLGV